MQRIETWLPIVNWEGLYEVSDIGRVQSLPRVVYDRRGRALRLQGRLLKPWPNDSGHLRVKLYRGGYGGPWQIYFVHHLVLEAFDRPCPPGMECRHGPGGPADNRWPENICWGTREDNQGPDRVRDGTSNRGERSGMAKLTEVIVSECRRRNAGGETAAALAAEFGISDGTMSRALRGETWTHVLPAGQRFQHAKLTEAIVRECRRRYAAGETQTALAAEFGVSVMAMNMTIRGLRWGHVT